MERMNLREERDFGQKINASFLFIQKNFRPLFTCLLYYAVPLSLIAGIFGGLYQSDVLSLTDTDAGAADNPFSFLMEEIYTLNYFMMLLVSLLSGLMVVGISFAYMAAYLEGDEAGLEPGAIWNRLSRQFGKLFAGGLLYILISGLSVMPAVLLFLVSPVALALGIIPVMCLSIYVVVLLSLFPAVLFVEQRQLGESFKRSIRLIKGKWWSTFGLIVVTSIIVSIVGFAFQLPLLLVGIAKTLKIWDADSQVVLILASVIAQVGSTLLYSIVCIAIGFQYFNLVERQESIGLMQEIGSIGTKQENKRDEGEY